MKKILVIDDERDIVDMLTLRLEANGYKVVSAFDGEAGLKEVKAQKPDLIILDILMPKLDGYNFVKVLKSDKANKNIPVIVISAKDKMKDLFAIEGVNEYLVKPFKDNELLDMIKKLLEKTKNEKNINS